MVIDQVSGVLSKRELWEAGSLFIPRVWPSSAYKAIDNEKEPSVRHGPRASSSYDHVAIIPSATSEDLKSYSSDKHIVEDPRRYFPDKRN